ncbi:MAG: endonuclease/exonuclease/phosphatase family protein [Prevotella sp.]|nr:endonuclease/exonuclease/phosphatase family protein [Prevotella sp.]
MNKLRILFVVLCCGVAFTVSAQKKFSVYAVGFYNQENLFDTCHDEGKNDYDFLPTGSYRWNARKYTHKLQNMARALADLGTDMLPNIGCAVIGMAEVENARALDDLVAQEPLRARNMKYVLIEGPDNRGIDCAMLYNPSLFTVNDVQLYPYVQEQEQDSAFYTRGFLTVQGTLANEAVSVIVCHWPSRYSSSYYRESAARQVRAIKDRLLRENPDMKVFVMGDMNDDPTNKSMTDGLSCKPDVKKVGDNDMFNPWYNVLVKQGTGTLAYDGAWNLFDQIVMTPNLLDRKGTKDYSNLTYLKSQVFRRDYLIQMEGKYKGNPKRTHAGGVWLDGYSDHLPVVVYLVKEQK